MTPDAGRTLDYLILRACERLDPRAAYGKPFNELALEEQYQFLGYDKVRNHEDSEHGTR